jgi:hypothetical protein
MFSEFDQLNLNKEQTIISYDFIQTSPGQSGSPILLRSQFNDQ